MKKPVRRSLNQFYGDMEEFTTTDVHTITSPRNKNALGHFNVLDIAQTINGLRETHEMPYSRRDYYKVSLIQGKSTLEYADKIIEIEENALLFATPKIPYHWIPGDPMMKGCFCIFTDEFLIKNKSGFFLDDLPIFRSGGYPVFKVNAKNLKEINSIFGKMKKEINSDYTYKFDLLRNYLMELIHYGQKLQPEINGPNKQSESTPVVALFTELLERQFPIESQEQRLDMRSPKDYAKRLAVSVNHLNKVLKRNTTRTTSEIINSRIVQEAKILLKHSQWNVSQIAYSLGFEQVAHFSNFFKKQTSLTPLQFRV